MNLAGILGSVIRLSVMESNPSTVICLYFSFSCCMKALFRSDLKEAFFQLPLHHVKVSYQMPPLLLYIYHSFIMIMPRSSTYLGHNF